MSKFIKILFLVILILKIFIVPVTAQDSIYLKKYTCHNHNCYDFDSFSFNKSNQTYSINMIVDLMDWNSHETYKSNNKDGYISHLIFKTSLYNGKVTAKCIGFVVSDIVPTYKNGQPYSMYYDNMIVHMTKPKSIKKDTHEIIISFYNWIDISDFISTVKSLANK